MHLTPNAMLSSCKFSSVCGKSSHNNLTELQNTRVTGYPQKFSYYLCGLPVDILPPACPLISLPPACYHFTPSLSCLNNPSNIQRAVSYCLILYHDWLRMSLSASCLQGGLTSLHVIDQFLVPFKCTHPFVSYISSVPPCCRLHEHSYLPSCFYFLFCLLSEW